MRTKEMEKGVIDQQKEVDDEIEEKKSVGKEGRDDFFLHNQQKNKMNEPVRAASDQLGSSPIIPSRLHASINI